MVATEVEERWRRLAAERRARWEAPGRIALKLHGHTLRIETRGAQVQLTLTWTPQLPVDLEVRNLVDEDYWEFFSNPEITFDDDAFDEAVLVRGQSPYHVAQVLTAEVRTVLLQLRSVHLTRDYLVTSVALHTQWSDFARTVGKAIDDLEHLTSLLFPQPERGGGPYRSRGR